MVLFIKAGFLASAVLLSLANALPPATPRSSSLSTTTTTTTTNQHFSLPQVRNPRFTGHLSGAAQIARTYAKFGKPLPANVAAAVARTSKKSPSPLPSPRHLTRQSSGGDGSGSGDSGSNGGSGSVGTVTATPGPDDIEYFVSVLIGTPPQTVNLDVDTGSADLWVLSNLLGSLTGRESYMPSNSNTSRMLLDGWLITYGDGSSAGGTVYRDKVEIGGVSANSQAVEVANVVSPQFLMSNFSSGLLGLAFSSINQVFHTQQETWFDNVKDKLDEPVFAANLKHDEPGSYDFGFTNKSAYNGKLVYTEVNNSSGFWGFNMTGYRVGDNVAMDTTVPAIADTGTTLLYLPLAIVEAYYRNVDGAENDQASGGWVFPCTAQLPDFSVAIDDKDSGEETYFTVPGDYMNYAPVDDGSDRCFGGLQDSSSLGINIFGDIMLKALYVVFCAVGPFLGIAAKL